MTVERSNLAELIDMHNHIRESNLIEYVDDPFEDRLSFEAWKWLVHQPRLTHAVVMQLHATIMLGKLDVRFLGQNRKVNVTVGGRRCPEPIAAAGQLNEWLSDMRSWKKLEPIDMHIRFEKIHPFVDGNGRTGRMLLWWHEIKQGQAPTLFTFEKREFYYALFSEALA